MVRGGACALLALIWACNTTSAVAPAPASGGPVPPSTGASTPEAPRAANGRPSGAPSPRATAAAPAAAAALDAGSPPAELPEDMLEVPGGEFTMGADGIG